jgi:hypothetical protein
MDPIKRQPSRPEPEWRDGTPDWAALERTSRPSVPSSRPQPGPVIIPPTLSLPHPALQKGQIEQTIQPVFENPWLTYEAIVVISQGQSVFLARHRKDKATLVDIHLLKQQFSSVKPLLDTISQTSHPSFLGLVGCYCWEEQVFLVREPVELSVSHILASRCTITEDEIAAIVRPVCTTLNG